MPARMHYYIDLFMMLYFRALFTTLLATFDFAIFSHAFDTIYIDNNDLLRFPKLEL